MSLMDKLPHPILPEHSKESLRSRESYHLLRIVSEFVQSGEELKAIQPAVSIFGSARLHEDHPMYARCEQLARMLSDSGFSVISGGGPGLMEAANKGAYAGLSPSVGLNIVLPHEEQGNRYQDLSVQFQHFFPRKVMFVKHAVAYVVMPGGFGTLDEMFESLTLMQTNTIRKRPIILCGRSFWQGLYDWVTDTLVNEKVISPDDIHLIKIIDEPSDIVNEIFEFYEKSNFQWNKDSNGIGLGL